MDEEAIKPCIQDRLRSVAMRSKSIFASWSIICLTILILIIIKLPEILPILIGREVIIPILSEISLEGRFIILFSFSVAIFSSLQYKINKSLLRIEERRIQPELIAKNKGGREIIIENKGYGIAWHCEVTLYASPIDFEFSEQIDKIYPWSEEKIDFPEELWNEVFDLMVDIIYYTEEEVSPDHHKTWGRVFRKFGPIYDL